MSAHKHYASFLKNRGTGVDYCFFDSAGVCYNASFFEIIGVFAYEFAYRFRVQTNNAEIGFFKLINRYFLIYGVLFKSFSDCFFVTVYAHYMMKGVLLKAFAKTPAYKSQADYCNIHFCYPFFFLE